MKDKVITVKKNDLNVEKVYLNNIRVEEGILKSTLTCTDSENKKVQHEQNKVEIVLADVLAPAALELLGFEVEETAKLENKETGVDKKKKADAEKKAKDSNKNSKKELIKKPAEKTNKVKAGTDGNGTEGAGDKPGEGSEQNPDA